MKKTIFGHGLPALVIASAALFAASPTLADVRGGVEAMSSGDYATAVREWKKGAETGDPDAQFNLAQAYRLGLGVDRDLVRAEDLYSKAAARGHLQAADNYGLLLFQRGERSRAMPFLQAAAERGDGRAQYVLGLAHFNGDNVPRDWVRAYALATLAQRADIPQARGALTQMDQHISLQDRQKGVALAAELATKAEAHRRSQLAAADLDAVSAAPPRSSAQTFPSAAPSIAAAEQAVAAAAQAAGTASPATAGADYARPRAAAAAQAPQKTPPAASSTPATPPAAAPAQAKAAPAPKPSARTGQWRVQLGAFGVAGNAEALWNRLKNRPELAGHAKLLVPSGSLTKLQAGGFASRDEANAACASLKAAGIACLPASN